MHHSLNQQIFIKHPLYAKHCARPWVWSLPLRAYSLAEESDMKQITHKIASDNQRGEV